MNMGRGRRAGEKERGKPEKRLLTIENKLSIAGGEVRRGMGSMGHDRD